MKVWRAARKEAGLWRQHLRLGRELRSLAANRRTRWALTYLGATVLLRSRGILRRPVKLNVLLGGRAFTIYVKTRTELLVLQESGLQDAYAVADEIPASVILDLGANIGATTLRLLAAHPGARVIAVEADPDLAERLRKNVAGLPVTVVHAAICGETGERHLYRGDWSSWGNSLEHRLGGMQEPVMVPTLTLEDLFESEGIGEVDLLKLDIEGAEWELLDQLPPRFKQIIGEAHTRGDRSARSFVDRLGESMDVRWLEGDTTYGIFLASRSRTATA